MDDKALILEKIEALKELIGERFRNNDKDHKAILEQTCKTNGRVTNLEVWKNRVMGALVITNCILVPVLLMFIAEYIKRK